MSSLNPLVVLYRHAGSAPTLPAFSLGIDKYDSNETSKSCHEFEYETITYAQFVADVETAARILLKRLSSTQKGAVLGVWLGGCTYSDAVHIYGASRAGFIPQLCSMSTMHPEIIYSLLSETKAVALLHEPSYSDKLADCKIPTIAAIDFRHEIISQAQDVLPPLTESIADPVFILHTTGSTSGRPKLVPYTQRWLDAQHPRFESTFPGAQDVYILPGTMCHTASLNILLRVIHSKSSIVFPATGMPQYSVNELKIIKQQCGLTRVVVMPVFLASIIREAQKDLVLLSDLRSLQAITCGGATSSPELLKWALEQCIPLQNIYASTEAGNMLLSELGKHPNHLKVIPTFPAQFELAGETSEQGDQLFELVVPDGYPGLPDNPLLRSPDGSLRTGDLFQRMPDHQSFIWRGRNDDWIKLENVTRCDTKAIEHAVHERCSDLVEDCVVVGSNRRSPALLIELLKGVNAEKDVEIRTIIVQRLDSFNRQRYKHEQINNLKLIKIVTRGSLPRTAAKGNIRRRAVEEQYAGILDEIYAA